MITMILSLVISFAGIRALVAAIMLTQLLKLSLRLRLHRELPKNIMIMMMVPME